MGLIRVAAPLLLLTLASGSLLALIARLVRSLSGISEDRRRREGEAREKLRIKSTHVYNRQLSNRGNSIGRLFLPDKINFVYLFI